VDSRCLGSSQRRSFLTSKSRVFTGLTREVQKRETGSIRSEEDLRGWILGFWDSRVSPKFMYSHFLHKCHLSV